MRRLGKEGLYYDGYHRNRRDFDRPDPDRVQRGQCTPFRSQSGRRAGQCGGSGLPSGGPDSLYREGGRRRLWWLSAPRPGGKRGKRRPSALRRGHYHGHRVRGRHRGAQLPVPPGGRLRPYAGGGGRVPPAGEPGAPLWLRESYEGRRPQRHHLRRPDRPGGRGPRQL